MLLLEMMRREPGGPEVHSRLSLLEATSNLQNCLVGIDQAFLSAHSLGVEEWNLSETHSSMSFTLGEAVVVRCRGVVRAPVIPDGEIIGVLPSKSDLQIVVFDQQSQEPPFEILALCLGQAVDVLEVVVDGE